MTDCARDGKMVGMENEEAEILRYIPAKHFEKRCDGPEAMRLMWKYGGVCFESGEDVPFVWDVQYRDGFLKWTTINRSSKQFVLVGFPEADVPELTIVDPADLFLGEVTERLGKVELQISVPV